MRNEIAKLKLMNHTFFHTSKQFRTVPKIESDGTSIKRSIPTRVL